MTSLGVETHSEVVLFVVSEWSIECLMHCRVAGPQVDRAESV